MGTKSAQRNKVIPKAFRYFHYLQDIINHYIHPIKTNNKKSKPNKRANFLAHFKLNPDNNNMAVGGKANRFRRQSTETPSIISFAYL